MRTPNEYVALLLLAAAAGLAGCVSDGMSGMGHVDVLTRTRADGPPVREASGIDVAGNIWTVRISEETDVLPLRELPLPEQEKGRSGKGDAVAPLLPSPDLPRTRALLETASASPDYPDRKEHLDQAHTLLQAWADTLRNDPEWHLQFGTVLFLQAHVRMESSDRTSGALSSRRMQNTLLTAAQHIRRAQELSKDLAPDTHSDWLRKNAGVFLASTYEALGSLCWQRNDMAGAKSYYRLNKTVLEDLAHDTEIRSVVENSAYYLNAASLAAIKYADTCWHLGDREEAEAVYEREWLRVPERLNDDAMSSSLAGLMAAYDVLGNEALGNLRTEQAREFFGRASTLWPSFEQFLGQRLDSEWANSPGAPPARIMLATMRTRTEIGRAISALLEGDSEAAERHAEQAETFLRASGIGAAAQPIKQAVPTLNRMARLRAVVRETNSAPLDENDTEAAEKLHRLGMLLSEGLQEYAAFACLRRSRIIFEAREAADHPHARQRLYLFLGDFADVAAQNKATKEARAAIFRALALGRQLLEDQPDDPDIRKRQRHYQSRAEQLIW